MSEEYAAKVALNVLPGETIAPTGLFFVKSGLAAEFPFSILLFLGVLLASIWAARRFRSQASELNRLERATVSQNSRIVELEREKAEMSDRIAELTASHKMLSDGEIHYRELFDNANDIILTTDLHDRFTAVNRAAERICGYRRDELVAMSFQDLVLPEQRELVQVMTDRKLGGEGETVYEAVILTKQKRRVTLELNTRLLFDGGKPKGILGIARDITERKRLEQQLHQSQKLEAIGRLAGGVAHDFNNLVTVMWAYGQMLKDGLEQDPVLQAYAQEILLAAERASGLTTRLLAFSRRQIVEPRIVNLNATVQNVDNMLRRLIGEDVELTAVLEPKLWKVQTDPAQMEQVIFNLAVNARDAMPSGGSLVIETSNISRDDVPPAAKIVGPCVALSVTDTGHGMTEDVRSHLFEPFFTTKESGKGTGLGLSIVYGIVKQSGGFVAVDSEPNKGSRFTIYLPAVQQPESAELADDSLEPQPAQGTETVLLVEDEPKVRELLHRMLVDQGYKVLQAAGGDESLSVSKQHQGPIHLLLTDVVMPKMSGRELAERLCAEHPEMKVLYMTGYTDHAIFHEGSRDEHLAVLRKPFHSGVLARKIRDVMSGKARC